MTDQTPFIITTDSNTSKYLTDDPYTNSYASASVSVAVGSYTTRTFVVPLSTVTRLYSIWVNVSLDGSTYVKIPNRDRQYGGVRNIATTISSSGDSATITMYLVNISGSTQVFPAFTVNVIRRDYVDEF